MNEKSTIHTHPRQAKKAQPAAQKTRNRFSLKKKLILIFGLLIALASAIEGFLAVQTARRAVLEKIETHLIDKANDTAEIINGRITAFLQFMEGIARMPLLRDADVSVKEKANFLNREVTFNTRLKEMNFSDINGKCTLSDGSLVTVDDREWFRAALSGKKYFSAPYISRATGELIAVLSVPIYDENRTIIGVLSADVSGFMLSGDIADIVIGQTQGFRIIMRAILYQGNLLVCCTDVAYGEAAFSLCL